MRRVLADTGPIVALLSKRDQHHAWAREVFGAIEPPLFTCESVLSEAMYLLAAAGTTAVLDLLTHGVIVVDFRADTELRALKTLVTRYASVPMSLADACLVRMTELEPDSAVLTLDSDFRVYRRSGRHVIPVIMPGDR